MQSQGPRHSPRQAKSGVEVEGLPWGAGRGAVGMITANQSDLPATHQLRVFELHHQVDGLKGKADCKVYLAFAVFKPPIAQKTAVERCQVTTPEKLSSFQSAMPAYLPPRSWFSVPSDPQSS